MAYSPTTDAPSDQASLDLSKVRQCLRCKAEFRSEWAGERVCSHCKSSHAWRNGAPLRSFSSHNRR